MEMRNSAETLVFAVFRSLPVYSRRGSPLMTSSTASKLLLLAGAGDGPWRATRYRLFEGSPDGLPLITTRISASSLRRLLPIGAVLSHDLGSFDAATGGDHVHEEPTRSFSFQDDLPAPTLHISECGYAAGGVGHQVCQQAVERCLSLCPLTPDPLPQPLTPNPHP